MHTLFTRQFSYFLDTSPTAYFAYGRRKNSRTAVPTAAVSIKVKRSIALSGNHLTATVNHMPYGITRCYLSPSSGDFPTFTPAEAGTRFSDPGGMHG